MSFLGKKKLFLVCEILSFRIICLSFFCKICLSFLALSFFRNVQKKPGIKQSEFQSCQSGHCLISFQMPFREKPYFISISWGNWFLGITFIEYFLGELWDPRVQASWLRDSSLTYPTMLSKFMDKSGYHLSPIMICIAQEFLFDVCCIFGNFFL